MTKEQEVFRSEPVLPILLLLCNPDIQSDVWATPPADLVTATFADSTELTGTRQHPVWCVTRQDWVGLGELLPGEEVATRQGPLAVRTVEDVPGLQPVYNLEVHGEHVYEVTDVGVLVHNNASADCLRLAELQNKVDLGGVLSPDELTDFNRLKVLFAPKIRTGKWGQGSLESAAQSLESHFAKHRQDVGARDIDQYLRKAEEFARNLKGATKSAVEGHTSGVTRYRKLGKYIDLDRDGNIISFGI